VLSCDRPAVVKARSHYRQHFENNKFNDSSDKLNVDLTRLTENAGVHQAHEWEMREGSSGVENE